MSPTGVHKIRPVVAWLLALAISATACVPTSTRPVIKIGLVAPFVGRYREIGEEVIVAARLAVREVNQAGGVRGYTVELMAYDDEGASASAQRQAQKLTTDSQVLAVLGNWLDATTLAAAPIYGHAALPFLATTASPDLDTAAFRLWYAKSVYEAGPQNVCPLPCEPDSALAWLTAHPASSDVLGPATWGLNLFPLISGSSSRVIHVLTPSPLPVDSTDPAFASRYQAISGGTPPRFFAVLAYDAVRLLLAAFRNTNGPPDRKALAAALQQADFQGLSGRIRFDGHHNWRDASGWLYSWQDSMLQRP